MAVRAFGTYRRRHYGAWVLAAALMGTTALVGTPKAEAAGEIVNPSRPDLGYAYYEIPALSADGRMFVGNVDDWRNGVLTGHHVTPERTSILDSYGSLVRINGMSGNGQHVVGTMRDADGYQRSFLWDVQSNGAEFLGLLYAGIPNAHSVGRDVSGDGTRVVGTYSRTGIVRGFAWIKGATTGEAGNERMYRLNGLDDSNRWEARAISDDGRYAVGYSDGNATNSLAVRWDLSGLEAGGSGAGVILSLGSFTGETGHSSATDVSADGRVVVGQSVDDDGFDKAFRWVEGSVGGDVDNVQMHNLGALGENPENQSGAQAVSRDGQYVVGWSDGDTIDRLAFRWSEETGMESMHQWLERNGVAVGDLTLTNATAIADDGQVIAGVMVLPDSSERAYIARVTGGVPGGLMDVAEYQRSLFSVTSVANAGEFLTWLPMNGAHHRPLMQQGNLADGNCVWATGDFGQHGESGTALGLAEAGGCVELFGGAVTAGLGVGTSHSWQTLALGGSSRLSGQYVIGEVDWQPDGTPLLLSVTGMLGGWQANIHRGYSNGAATAYSDGTTGIGAGVVRLRADWLEAARLGNTSINPWASVAFGRQQIACFAESGGPFPAHFDAQSLGMAEVRLGVAAITDFSAETRLTTTLELVHRGGDAAAAKGNVVGLFDFNLGGGARGSTWVRAGLELDHKVADNIAVSGAVHAATNGRDPSISGSLGIKMSF